MKTRILFFGRLRDAAGGGERLARLAPGLSIDALIDEITGVDTALAAALRDPSVNIAVDQRLVPRSTIIDAAREIAFLPPYSGG